MIMVYGVIFVYTGHDFYMISHEIKKGETEVSPKSLILLMIIFRRCAMLR